MRYRALSPILIAHGMVIALAFTPRPAWSQCPATMCGSFAPADSVPPPLSQVDYQVHICEVGGSCPPQPIFGSSAWETTVCIEGPHGGNQETRWDVFIRGFTSGNPSPYFRTPATFVGTCVGDPGGGCATCSGGFGTLQLFATHGNFAGDATSLPWNTPANGYIVTARRACNEGNLATTPASVGTYDFTRGAPVPFPENHWGWNVVLDSPNWEASGPVTNSFMLNCYACNPPCALPCDPSTAVSADTTSSTTTSVDVTCWSPETPDRPDIRSCPSVGQPVSVATGNVFLDQVDATVPGASLAPLTFIRSYNSANTSSGQFGMFGPGWSTSYERKLSLLGNNLLMLRGADGVVSYFARDTSEPATWRPSVPFSLESAIKRQSDQSYVREFRQGGSERYQADQQGGRLTAIVDAAGNTTELEWDGSQLDTIRVPGGRELTLVYLNPTTVTLSGPAGLIATYTLRADGLLESVQYADSEDDDSEPDGGYSFDYYPTTPPRLWKVKDGDGTVVETHEYDTQGRATTSEVSGGIEKFTLVYDPLKAKTTVTDANGNATVYEYSHIWGMRRPIRTTGPCASCGAGTGVQSWTYDNRGRVLSQRDAEGYETRYTYDQVTGDVLSETKVVDLATGATHVTAFTYWPDEPPGEGRLHMRTAPNGAVTMYEYDPPGPKTITEQTEATRFRTTNITYTPQGEPGAGKVKFVDDPRQKRWEYHYLASGDLEWIKDPLGNLTRFTYDLMGRQKQVIPPIVIPVPGTPVDPPIQEPETTYDTLGRVSRIRNPDDGTTTRFTYDGGGRRRTMTDALGRLTEHFYDTWGRLWKVRDALQYWTEYGYDSASNLTSIRDARGKITTFVPDSSNRVEKICYPSNEGEQPCHRYERFTYDGVGRLKTRGDGLGLRTTFVYDGLGRLKSKTYADGTPSAIYTYDGGAASQKGRLTSAVTGQIALGWSYDLAGQALTATRTIGTTTRTLGYTYDDAGHRETLRLDGQLLATYFWDDRSLLDHIVRTPDRVFQFKYDTASRRKSLLLPNAVTTAYGYDQRSRLSNLSAGGGTITNFTYPTYDAMNTRTARGGTTAPAESYEYTQLYQLRQVNRGTPPQVAEKYEYDEVGNRRWALQPPDWTYSNRNELLSRPGVNYAYDLSGNLVQKTEGGNIWLYEWDAENQLKLVRKNGSPIASYTYDALGRRTQRFFGGSNLEDYLYDGEDILRSEFTSGGVEEGPLFEMTDHLYVHGPGIDEPLEVSHGTGETWYYHADGLGSIVRVTDEDGQLVPAVARQYDAFGRLEVGGAYEGYAFTAREWDPETGLYYYRARYYDPMIGRFLSEDPIRFRGGINFYAYVDGNPVNYVDPTGLILWKCTRRSGGALGQIDANHVYFCNPATGKSCGKGKQGDKSAPRENEQCPGPNCVPLPDSVGKEQAVLNCCLFELPNDPDHDSFGASDNCWTYFEECLNRAGIEDKDIPGGMFGCPGQCPGCPPGMVPFKDGCRPK